MFDVYVVKRLFCFVTKMWCHDYVIVIDVIDGYVIQQQQQGKQAQLDQ